MLLGPTFCIVYIFVCLKFVNLVCKVFYLCLFVLLFVLLFYLYLWLVWKLVVCWWSDRSIKLDSVLSEGWFQPEDCFSAAAQFFTLPSHDGCILRWGREILVLSLNSRKCCQCWIVVLVVLTSDTGSQSSDVVSYSIALHWNIRLNISVCMLPLTLFSLHFLPENTQSFSSLFTTIIFGC